MRANCHHTYSRQFVRHVWGAKRGTHWDINHCLYLLLIADCFAAGCSQHSAANFLNGLCRCSMYVIDIKTLIRLSFSFDPHAPDGRHGLVLRLESWREANNLGQAQASSRSRLRGTCRPKLATVQRWEIEKALAACDHDPALQRFLDEQPNTSP